MRNNFWKWLKRFFVVLPIIMFIFAIIATLGQYWRHTSETSFYMGDEDFIESFVINGFSNEIRNPLLYTRESIPAGFMGNIYETFYSTFEFFLGDFPSDIYPYFVVTFNFLVWWIFVELTFLLFRFITFLISWVNSLFDNTFKKIKR